MDDKSIQKSYGDLSEGFCRSGKANLLEEDTGSESIGFRSQ